MLDPTLILTATIAATPPTVVAFAGWRRSKKNSGQIADQLATGNGHTIGEAAARLENQGLRIERRIDTIVARIDRLDGRQDNQDQDLRHLKGMMTEHLAEQS